MKMVSVKFFDGTVDVIIWWFYLWDW